MTQPLTIDVAADVFPIAGSFRISRGAKTEAHVVVVRMVLRGGGQEWQGWGECVPYARYGETVEGCLAQAGLVARTLEKDALKALGAKKGPGESLAADLAAVLAALQERLQEILAPGAARNAVDCALWDLRAAVAGQSVRALLGLPALLAPLRTAETLSLDAPAAMAARAKAKADRPLLKLKLGAEKSADCLKAIRAAAPEAALIVDANEAWAPEALPELFALCSELGVAMIEQPLPADDDQALAEIARPVPVYADESCHTAEGLAALKDRYDGINIKLDKTGGLTGALTLAQAAEAENLEIMIGCMLATSLAMAPGLVLADRAAFVDLDGPVLLARDRPGGLRIEQGWIQVPAPENNTTPFLWGRLGAQT